MKVNFLYNQMLLIQMRWRFLLSLFQTAFDNRNFHTLLLSLSNLNEKGIDPAINAMYTCYFNVDFRLINDVIGSNYDWSFIS